MPKLLPDPQSPETWTNRDLTLAVRLLPNDRIAVEKLKDGVDAPRASIVRALVRAGLASVEGDPRKLVHHLTNL